MLAQSFFREEIDLATRVFGDNGNDQKDGEWKSIRDLPPLQLAMEALMESEMPSSWPVDTPWTGNGMANTTNDDDKNASYEIDAEINRRILIEHACLSTNEERIIGRTQPLPRCFHCNSHRWNFLSLHQRRRTNLRCPLLRLWG